VSDQAADPARVTALIEDARAGKAEALDALLPLVYAELRRVACSVCPGRSRRT